MFNEEEKRQEETYEIMPKRKKKSSMEFGLTGVVCSICALLVFLLLYGLHINFSSSSSGTGGAGFIDSIFKFFATVYIMGVIIMALSVGGIISGSWAIWQFNEEKRNLAKRNIWALVFGILAIVIATAVAVVFVMFFIKNN